MVHSNGMKNDAKPLLYDQIMADPMNAGYTDRGWRPVYSASPYSRIVVVGQAPGRVAQETGKPWNDISGQNLRRWLDVTEEQFYNPELFALIPMDFYYPGKGKHGDLPPRREFAEKWHSRLLDRMTEVKLIILVGAYAQKFYLAGRAKRDLTETVASYVEYLPKYFPLVHPSPLNFRWRKRNPWFAGEVIPALQRVVREVLAD